MLTTDKPKHISSEDVYHVIRHNTHILKSMPITPSPENYLRGHLTQVRDLRLTLRAKFSIVLFITTSKLNRVYFYARRCVSVLKIGYTERGLELYYI